MREFLALGATVERYVVESVLEASARSVVYAVRHQQLDSVHALKVLSAPSPAQQRRLFQEGRVQAALRHPNILPVTDLVSVGGAPALVMDLVEGPTLGDWLKTEPPLDQIDAIARGILAGVAAAHAAGLVHRDLKPSNVLLQPTADAVVPQVTDFGLVLQPGERLTADEVLLGTPGYMAPEQARDAAGVDARADVYSLGVLLQQMVAHHVVPVRMADAIAGATPDDPDDRFPSVDALSKTWCSGVPTPDPWTVPLIEAIRRDPPPSSAPTVLPPIEPPPTRYLGRRWWPVLVSVGVLMTVGVVGRTPPLRGPATGRVMQQEFDSLMMGAREPVARLRTHERVVYQERFDAGWSWSTLESPADAQWSIIDGAMAEASDDGSSILLAPFSTPDDAYSVSTRVLLHGVGNDAVGLVFGLRGERTFHMVRWLDPDGSYGLFPSGSAIDLYRCTAGHCLIVASDDWRRTLTATPGVWAELAVAVNDTEATVYFDGEELFTFWGERPVGGGQIGVWRWDTDGGVAFDDVIVRIP